ncbi:response regulator [Ensifer sp. LCM 4579]|uniref:response regulator n=1 Tax=Ensifer sp. LCM 4579 TaxID=1848292 RepID=UPI0008D931E9|nr:response regulator [Ensifer sp. LCM 4579]OHV81370.1 hypothetical protein LCM4579_20270 [Ensifer sp. LCM 4579]
MTGGENVTKIQSVLVLEDNFLIAMDMEEMLAALGVTHVYTATTAERAMEIATEYPIDFAIVDIRLGDETSFTVAEALVARGIKIGFASGCGEILPLPSHLRDVPRIEKPFTEGSLSSLIAAGLRPRSP